MSEDSDANIVQTHSDYFTQILRSESFNHTIAPYYINPYDKSLNYGPTSIMDKPAEKLTLEFLNFDYNKNLDLIMTTLSSPPITNITNSNGVNEEKFKNNLVICQSPGMGTTRTLEELKMMMNQQPECLAIAIAYGSDWAVYELELFNPVRELYGATKSIQNAINVCMVLSVITRVTAMLYGIPLARAQALYHDNQHLMPKIDITKFHLVLIAFVKAIVGEMRQAGRPVSNVLFLIDETADVNDILEVMRIKDIDPWQVIRDTIPGSDMHKYTHVNTAMVFATIDYGNLKVPIARHPYVSIFPPGKLSAEDIVEKWWKPLFARSGVVLPEEEDAPTEQ